MPARPDYTTQNILNGLARRPSTGSARVAPFGGPRAPLWVDGRTVLRVPLTGAIEQQRRMMKSGGLWPRFTAPSGRNTNIYPNNEREPN